MWLVTCHENYVCDGGCVADRVQVAPGLNQLLHDLSRLKVPPKAHPAGETELTVHGASQLAGHAYCYPLLTACASNDWDEYSLDVAPFCRALWGRHVMGRYSQDRGSDQYLRFGMFAKGDAHGLFIHMQRQGRDQHARQGSHAEDRRSSHPRAEGRVSDEHQGGNEGDTRSIEQELSGVLHLQHIEHQLPGTIRRCMNMQKLQTPVHGG